MNTIPDPRADNPCESSQARGSGSFVDVAKVCPAERLTPVRRGSADVLLRVVVCLGLIPWAVASMFEGDGC